MCSPSLRVVSMCILAVVVLFASANAGVEKSKPSAPERTVTGGPGPSVDINSASLEELTGQIGLKKETAEKIISARPFHDTEELVKRNIISEDRYAKIKDRLVAKPHVTSYIGPWEAVLIWLALVITGVILGLNGTITVYRDFSDLTATFGVFILPVGLIFGAMVGLKEWALYLIGAITVLLFIWSAYCSYKDNRNILYALLALITKVSLAFVVVFKGFESWGARRYSDKMSAATWVAALGSLALALVRDKPGKAAQASATSQLPT